MKNYEKPVVECVLYTKKSYVVTISATPVPGPNEMPPN